MGGGVRYSVTSLFARKAKIFFSPKNKGELGDWEVLLGPLGGGNRLFGVGDCSVRGHCPVILGGGDENHSNFFLLIFLFLSKMISTYFRCQTTTMVIISRGKVNNTFESLDKHTPRYQFETLSSE